MVEMCASWPIISYNKLLSMVGPDNWIVKTIQDRCSQAELEDSRVPCLGVDACPLEVLASWSDTITKYFQDKNNKK